MPGFAPDISGSIPAVVSALELFAGSTGTVAYDVNIAGLPFMLAPSPEHPYTRETAPHQKQQIDTSREPGEQSLSQWWVRDQDSWHRGAGIRFYDPGTDDTTARRFEDSRGVDVFSTKGQFTLLKSMASAQSTGSATCYATGAVVGGTDSLFTNIGGTVYRYDSSAHAYTVSSGGTPAGRVAVAGTKILVGTSAGISSADASGSALTELWTGAGTTMVPWWVKSRIIASHAAVLYELTLAGGALPATPLWTHPDTGWTWTGVAEAPDSILAAGYNNGRSSIYAFVLYAATEADGGAPTLSQPIQVAEMPFGEEIHSLFVYLGSFVAIGTSKGLRIGTVDTLGKLTYGPLLLTTTSAVVDLTAWDRFVYAVTIDPEGIAAAIRVDLGEQITPSTSFTTLQTNIFAYAWDARSTTGTPTSIAMFGASGRLAIAVASVGTYIQSATLYESSGYLKSGRIRYATSEPKQFAFAKVQSSIPSTTGTSVALATIDADGTQTTVTTLTSASDTSSDINLTTLSTATKYAQLLVTLSASLDQTATATVEDVQVKALPQPVPQRTVVFPLMLLDFEQDRKGVQIGVKGGAWARLGALEALEAAQAIVVVSDYTSGEVFNARIDSVKVTRIAPPDRQNKNYGGRLDLTLTKLT